MAKSAGPVAYAASATWLIRPWYVCMIHTTQPGPNLAKIILKHVKVIYLQRESVGPLASVLEEDFAIYRSFRTF